jgi:hypothetical protein
MRPAKKNVVVENAMWDDGRMGEIEWHVFIAHESGAEAEEDAKSIGTSILFDHEDMHDAHDVTNELEFETDDAEDEWETMSSSCESTRMLLAPTMPPQVFLTRKNGEEFGDPRWSFAGKFNDHVLRKLASCRSSIPQHTLPNRTNVRYSAPRIRTEDTSEASTVYSDAWCCCSI